MPEVWAILGGLKARAPLLTRTPHDRFLSDIRTEGTAQPEVAVATHLQRIESLLRLASLVAIPAKLPAEAQGHIKYYIENALIKDWRDDPLLDYPAMS